MSMFRASPWINYTAGGASATVGDIDAPEISTLPQETTPPPSTPQPTSLTKFRVRLRLPAQQPGSESIREGQQDIDSEEEEEEEEEEDQLIDDDDDDVNSTATAQVTTGRAPKATTSKQKSSKVGSRKKKEKESVPAVAKSSAPEPSSMMSAWQAELPPPPTIFEAVIPTAPKAPSKRKAPAKKQASTAATTKQPRKSGSKAVKAPVPVQDDIGGGSGGEGHPSATSSPFPFRPEPASPPLPSNTIPSAYLPAPDDFSLDAGAVGSMQHVAVPTYPHPTRPFAVQPVPKMPSGQAPLYPLDRSGTRVRRWQIAHREIKGIGGGRWFARSWVGAKGSDFADSTPAFPVQPMAIIPSRPPPQVHPPALTTAVSVQRKKKDVIKPSQQEGEGPPALTFMQPQTGPVMFEDGPNHLFVPSSINVDSDIEMVPS